MNLTIVLCIALVSVLVFHVLSMRKKDFLIAAKDEIIGINRADIEKLESEKNLLVSQINDTGVRRNKAGKFERVK